jgi:hypothetical protein
VVWYRLSWQGADPRQPVALLLDYLNMAGAVYLNGSLLMRDTSLVEPLTRAWNTRATSCCPPRCCEGRQHAAGSRLGVVGLPARPRARIDRRPEHLRPAYDRAYWLRHDLQLISLAVTVALGCLFFRSG